MKDFTLEELTLFTKQVQQSTKKSGNMQKPSKAVDDKILAYSKALSIRPSKQLNQIEMILN